MNERPEWCEKCREYRPCSTCTYELCTVGCGRPLPSVDLVSAVQSGDAQASQGFCWGGPECSDIVAVMRSIEESPVVFHERRGPCTMGVGCDEYGACFADAHGRPEMCGRLVEVKLRYEEDDPAESPGIVIDESRQDGSGYPFVVQLSGETHYDTREEAEAAMQEYAVAIFRNVVETTTRAQKGEVDEILRVHSGSPAQRVANEHEGWRPYDPVSIVHDDYAPLVDLHVDDAGVMHYCALGHSWTEWSDLIAALDVDREWGGGPPRSK